MYCNSRARPRSSKPCATDNTDGVLSMCAVHTPRPRHGLAAAPPQGHGTSWQGRAGVCLAPHTPRGREGRTCPPSGPSLPSSPPSRPPRPHWPPHPRPPLRLVRGFRPCTCQPSFPLGMAGAYRRPWRTTAGSFSPALDSVFSSRPCTIKSVSWSIGPRKAKTSHNRTSPITAHALPCSEAGHMHC
jgi:hypothetical protein